MIEGIALALMKTLGSYLFKHYILATSTINIEGAPKWYMQNNTAQVCVYDHKTGSIEAVERAKDAAYPKMQKELSDILEAVIYKNYSNLKDPKEKQFVMMFKDDADAPVFIRKTMSFPAIEYREKTRAAFVKGCIDKDVIIEYQEKRTDKIRYELTHKRAGAAHDELESGDMSLE